MTKEDEFHQWLEQNGRIDKLNEFKERQASGAEELWSMASTDGSLFWKEEDINKFMENLDWEKLSWTIVENPRNFHFNVADTFPDRIEWNALLFPTYFSYLQFDTDAIKKFENYLDFNQLSCSLQVLWSTDLIREFESKLNFSYLSINPVIFWDKELLDLYKDRVDWKLLSKNEGHFWSVDLLEEYKEELSWMELSCNQALPWSVDLLERFKDRWDWGSIEIMKGERGEPDQTIPRGICANQSILWGKIFYEKFEDKIKIDILKTNQFAVYELRKWGIQI